MADSASCQAKDVIVVSGLVWQQAPERPTANDDTAIVGPAIGAGLGAICAGRSVTLLVSMTRGLSPQQTRFVDTMRNGSDLVTRVDLPPLVWRSGPIRANATANKFDGDPGGWPAPRSRVALSGHTLVLANGNPRDHAEAVRTLKPGRVAMDIDAGWGFAHPSALNSCIRAAALVAVTHRDFERLPSPVILGTGLGKPNGPALLLKRGEHGVVLRHDGAERVLPPPSLPVPVATDVGAGDFLLGFMAATMAARTGAIGIDDWEQAYLQSLPHLSRLLTSPSFHAFADLVFGAERDG